MSFSQITVLDSLKISPAQVKNIYTGLKTLEVTKIRLDDCVFKSNQLNDIIQDQNKSLQLSLLEIKGLNDQINTGQSVLLANAVDIEKLKNKKTPWYKHPILYTVLGIAAGVYIAK